LLTETTSLSDIEWMLARAAGFNAGFALATNVEAVRKNPEIGPILDAIREWESARRTGAFSSAQRELFKNPATEFHLEVAKEEGWKLFPYHESRAFRHERTLQQPGAPTFSRWEYTNPDQDQIPQFKLRVTGDSGAIMRPKFDIDGYATVSFPGELKAGQTLLCEGTTDARVYDAKGRQIGTVRSVGQLPILKKGKHEMLFTCEFVGPNTCAASVTFKTQGEAEKVTTR
jgi:hypothetical protein